MLFWILVFTFLGSVVSLLLAAALLFKKGLREEKVNWVVDFSAGSMLGAAFLDLLPEALKTIGGFGGFREVGGTVLGGIVGFFFLERSLLWYHHHGCPAGEDCSGVKPAIPLLIFGDGLHNLLDGIAVAAAFLVSWQLGVVTSLAIFSHEIPHELGNLGVLRYLGMTKEKALIVNLLTALVAVAGSLFAFFFLQNFQSLIPYLMAFAAGNFIYISVADLIPELHAHFEKETVISQSLSFLGGIMVIILVMKTFS